MKRIISLVLCVLMLAGMCACQKAEEAPAPTATPAPTAEPAAVETEQPAAPEPVAAPEGIGSYADAYLLYRSICTAMQNEVNLRLDAHNATLENKNQQEINPFAKG